MGKHGPCRHCGVTSTPLWRNGPPEKPVLCNACGSRWRTKGSLVNYTPLHARELIEWEEPKVAKMRSISFKTKEHKLLKRKQLNRMMESEMRVSELDQNYVRTLEGDISNRSSSGSAISYSESCANFAVTDASDWTGSSQSNAWDSSLVPVPSKRRSIIHPKPSPVEKLTKDLYSIWHEQQSSNISGSSEEDLLFEGDKPLGSFEIGHGGVLLRYPSYKAIEEESEASSLPDDIKLISQAYSRAVSFPLESESKSTYFFGTSNDKSRNSISHMRQTHVKRESYSLDDISMIEDRDSPLRLSVLKDIVSLDVFIKHMTNDEQQMLMEYLPSIDTTESHESLRSLFSSPSFMESLFYFKKLLRDGVFDLSFSQMNVKECRAFKHGLLSSMESQWVDHHGKMKGMNRKRGVGTNEGDNSTSYLRHNNLATFKRVPQVQNVHMQESKRLKKTPKIVCRFSNTKSPCTKSSLLYPCETESTEAPNTEAIASHEAACYSPRSLFAWPPNLHSGLQFSDNSSDHELLLDVRCSSSFPDAELLHPPWNENTLSNSSRAESCAVTEEDSLCNFSVSNFSAHQLNQHI